MNEDSVWIVYGAGDDGTKEIINEIVNRGFTCEFRDTRFMDGVGNRPHLLFVSHSGFRELPQVFFPDGKLCGEYYKTMEYLKWMDEQKRLAEEAVKPVAVEEPVVIEKPCRKKKVKDVATS